MRDGERRREGGKEVRDQRKEEGGSDINQSEIECEANAKCTQRALNIVYTLTVCVADSQPGNGAFCYGSKILRHL